MAVVLKLEKLLDMIQIVNSRPTIGQSPPSPNSYWLKRKLISLMAVSSIYLHWILLVHHKLQALIVNP